MVQSSAVATTGSDVARPSKVNNGERVMTDAMLTRKHLLLIDYMVHGCHVPSLLARTKIPVAWRDETTGQPIMQHRQAEPGEPLDIIQAAACCMLTRRAARNLSKQAAFQRRLGAAMNSFRESAKPKAVHRMVALIDEPGQGKAADRKVQLAAAQAILGESESRSGTTVNVQVNNQVTAGIVIDLRDDDPPTLELTP